jgi:4-hydroxy-tetrahydrodipicolinate synthase
MPNIYGVKEASGDISQVGDICSRAPADFHVFSGDDALTLPVIALGGCGVISVSANEVPGMMTAFCRSCLENRWDEARTWNRKLYPLMMANFIESNPIPVKGALALMGKISEVYRLPLVPMGNDARIRLAKVLADLELVAR